MKGMMVLERKINKLFRDFGIVAYCGERFEYSNSVVSFTPYFWDRLSRAHCEYIDKTFGIDVRSSYFTFCILHEIGHHYTLRNFTEEEIDNEIIIRKLLSFCEKDPKEINDAYFNLPIEEEATKWALEYMVNHVSWVNRVNRLCCDALRHYFKVNGWG